MGKVGSGEGRGRVSPAIWFDGQIQMGALWYLYGERDFGF